MKAKDIINYISNEEMESGLYGLTYDEFVRGVKGAFGCSIRTARAVAKLTGNWL